MMFRLLSVVAALLVVPLVPCVDLAKSHQFVRSAQNKKYPTTRDFATGLELYRKGRYEQALRYLLNAAKNSDVQAYSPLAEVYYLGRGTEVDEGKAFRYARLAAVADLPMGQYQMGYCYEHGIGTEADVERAMSWYLRSARQDCLQAQMALGRLYFDGIGVEKDRGAAIAYLQRSAELGYRPAIEALAELER